MKRLGLLLFIAVCLSVATPGQAFTVDLFPDTGWHEFYYDLTGSDWRLPGSRDPLDYYIDITEACFLTVTDGYLKGDQFEIFNYGLSGGLSSAPIPNDGLSIGNDYDASALNEDWSTVVFGLYPGTYSISGTVYHSPSQSGVGAIRLDTFPVEEIEGQKEQPVVPEPLTILTLGFGLLGGFGLKRKLV